MSSFQISVGPNLGRDENGRNRPSSFCSTDVVDFSGGRDSRAIKLGIISPERDNINTTDSDNCNPADHFIEIVLANRENTRNVGWLISDDDDAIEEEVNIPFYQHVTEGGECSCCFQPTVLLVVIDLSRLLILANFNDADWKDQPVVRQAKISWKDDSEIAWLERHMEMTQGFILVGKSPGLMILGEPTHEREDLSETERKFPDISRLKGYLIPAGCGIILKKGTWHDFPVSVGPNVNIFVLNTAEVVDALMSMKEPGPMNFGDCYKIRNADIFQSCTLRYPDPRPIAKSLGLLPKSCKASNDSQIALHDAPADAIPSARAQTNKMYVNDMVRVEVATRWAGEDSGTVWVVPVVNVESFSEDEFGPSVQPHLNRTQPEIANKGWRNYGNKQGLKRLGNLFKKHDIACTAVVSSDIVEDNHVMAELYRLRLEDKWEIGAHGSNNSSGGHAGLTREEETRHISKSIKSHEKAFGTTNKMSWLTPGFSVTSLTPKLLLDAGVKTLLDFGEDDRPFLLKNSDEKATIDHSLVCLPYHLECNDFTLILTRHLSPREYAAALESHIRQLAKESRDSRCSAVVCLGMHTFVAGTPSVAYELDKMLNRLKCTSNIKWSTAEQVSSIVRARKNELEDPIETLSSATAFQAQGAIQNLICQTKPSLLKSPLVIQATPSTVQVSPRCLGLILIDMQNDFMSSDGFGEKLGNDSVKLDHIISPTKAVLRTARSAGLTIIHTREGHRSNLSDLTQLKASSCSSIGVSNGKGRSLVRGEWGSEFIPDLAPLDSETIIDKPGKGSFYQTDLELVLRNANIDTLIVCGVTTEVCVHSTVRDATDRGIKCIVLRDCTASYFDSFHQIGLEMISAQGGIFGSVSDSESIIHALEN